MIEVLRKIKRRLFQGSKSQQYNIKNDTKYSDFTQSAWDTIQLVKPFTRTSPERIYSLIQSINYIEENGIQGDIVECGVWRGGSMMAAAKSLLERNSNDRKLYLYDTFEGMTEATEKDVSFRGKKATSYLAESDKYDEKSVWCYASLEDVELNMKLVAYPQSNIIYVKGKVEETIPETLPDKIAILRLDTDWYESTKHELVHLFPRLVKGGILIIDDYGHWQGARMATDEYFKENNIIIFLNRVDYTCRVAVKI